MSRPRTPTEPRPSTDALPPISQEDLVRRAHDDNRLMAAFLLDRGLPVPLSIVQRLDESADGQMPSAEALALDLRDHAVLSAAIRPATPNSLVFLRGHLGRNRSSVAFGIPLVRRLMLAAAGSIAVFAASAASTAVNETSGDVFASSAYSSGINEVFLLSAASIGASFAGLFKANVHVARFTFEPRYEPTYWARLLLGLIAGLALSEVIPLGESGGDSTTITRPVLALLGGFSAEFVHSVLDRLIGFLSSLVASGLPEIPAIRAEAIRAPVVIEPNTHALTVPPTGGTP